MKKPILFFALASMVAFTNCSKDNDDTDPIVGTWVSETSITPEGGETTTYADVWVFEEDHTGAYTDTTNGEVNRESDFIWTKTDEGYEVDYEEEVRNNETFTIGELLGKTTLEQDGALIAIKE